MPVIHCKQETMNEGLGEGAGGSVQLNSLFNLNTGAQRSLPADDGWEKNYRFSYYPLLIMNSSLIIDLTTSIDS